MILRFFTNDERVIGEPTGGALVKNGCGNRVRSHSQATHSVDLGDLGNEIKHHLPDQRGNPVVEADFSQIDVIRCFLSAGEGEVTAKNGLVGNVVDELLSRIRHVGQFTAPRCSGHIHCPVSACAFRCRYDQDMRIATWNVNSIRTRVGRVVDWLVREDVDVLALQEIKCTPAQFPFDEFERAGYEVTVHGLNQWNGVALAARHAIDDVEIGFPDMPGFQKGQEGPDLPREARAIGATVAGLRLWSLYVPNGRGLDDLHYAYKLEWLRALRANTERWLAAEPNLPLALMGDWNVAPLDSDVGDPSIIAGVSTHVSPAERDAFFAFEHAGVTDVVRPRVPEGYTYWDYKQLRFPRNEGLRIDFILASVAFADRVVAAHIDRDERKGDSPSDHVPVVVDLANDAGEDDDDRPMFW